MSAGRRLRVLFTSSEAYLIERNAIDLGFGWDALGEALSRRLSRTSASR